MGDVNIRNNILKILRKFHIIHCRFYKVSNVSVKQISINFVKFTRSNIEFEKIFFDLFFIYYTYSSDTKMYILKV